MLVLSVILQKGDTVPTAHVLPTVLFLSYF